MNNMELNLDLGLGLGGPDASSSVLYDLVVVGAGCAGLGGAIYAKRFNLETLVVGREFGGLITTTHVVENYPGFPSISGMDLMEEFRKHVQSLDIPIVEDEVAEVARDGDYYTLETRWSGTFRARSVLLATGSKHRKLGIPGEEEYFGRGVSYCATCDGPLFGGKVLGVVGGSDSAAKEALFLSDIASKVYILYRRQEIRAEPINKARVERNDKIEVIPNVNVVKVLGDEFVTGVELDNGEVFPLDGLFIEIGQDPEVELAVQLGVALNDKREIVIDEASRTDIPGVFAAGDCCNAVYKQAITGVAEGVKAAYSAFTYVGDQKAREGSRA
ncbi:MAG: NAD(P)/FAD-dependent oxidoreductase [Promethearchaeota archaeon]